MKKIIKILVIILIIAVIGAIIILKTSLPPCPASIHITVLISSDVFKINI